MDIRYKNIANVTLLDDEKDVKTLVQEHVKIQEKKGSDDSFVITDLGDVIKKFRNWQALLPRVSPFYATKCNNDPVIFNLMADIGSSFDCSTQEEIRSILDLGVAPERILYAQTIKQASTYAAEHNVFTMTFDNEDELYKTKRLCPGARLVIRIIPPGKLKIMSCLGIKFGCHLRSVTPLLKLAKTLDLNVLGVSFHVGKGCEDPEVYTMAIKAARQVVDNGRELGFCMDLVNIGGGMPGQSFWHVPFIKFANAINHALDKYFPADSDSSIRIIAEPGKYFVGSASTLVSNIIAKREVIFFDNDLKDDEEEKRDGQSALTMGFCEAEIDQSDKQRKLMYYINNGVYGFFLHWKFADITLPVHSLKNSEVTYKSQVWGPTCDTMDGIHDNVDLPEHDIGDWLYFPDMGAYTISCSSGFNGMPQPQQNYVCLKQTWMTLYNN